jgi:carbon monoxide dehydrogenase subunit G
MIELGNRFGVPAPVEETWQLLLDVERIAPCMPGARLEAANAATGAFEGSVRVKVGAMVITYRGSVRVLDADSQSHRALLEAWANEARGGGTAKASVIMSLAPPSDEGVKANATEVTLHTSLHITGKPAQFGRTVLAEVAERLIAQFAEQLRTELSTPSASGATADAPVGVSAAAGASTLQSSESVLHSSSNDSIDLLAVAGGAVAKRVAAGVAAAGLLLTAVWFMARWRRSGGSSGAGRTRRTAGWPN